MRHPISGRRQEEAERAWQAERRAREAAEAALREALASRDRPPNAAGEE